MCLLALLFRVVEDAAVVVGANREEQYARPGSAPQALGGPVRATAGLDPVAGGTWLGVNEFGVLAAVTNRRKTALPVNARSRGLLTRDLLGCRSAEDAAELAQRELTRGQYAGANFLVADRDYAVVLQAGDWLRVRPLPPGVHVLTNRDVNDATDPRLGRALATLRRSYASAQDAVEALRGLCSQAGGDAPIILRGPNAGTVSSSILALRSPVTASTYLHSQGPPDRVEYQDYSPLLRSWTPSEA